MSEQSIVGPDELDHPALSHSSGAGRWSFRLASHWELAVAVVAVVAAVAAFWVTVNARFLQYPYWLGVQKADFILGPVFVGLYWHRRRPDNHLGLLMIALGLIFIPYVLESIRSPYPFTIGTMVEAVYIPLALAIVLAFPNGRLDGRAERLILVAVVIGYTLPYLVWLLVSPDQLIPRLSLSGCRALCPRNPFAVSSTPSWYPQSVDFLRASLIAVDLATVGLLVWKFVTGTPPRRRALAVGAPIAMCYLLAQSTYQTVQLVDAQFGAVTSQNLNGPLQWVIAGFRAAPWYGFLFALIAAELFAGRVLRDVVRRSLGRPSLRELERVLREPLGDPGLRLGLWRAGSHDWVGHDGAVLEPPGPGQALTEVQRDGRPAAAIVHDAQLSEDPELLQAAGAAVLLAQENAELDAAWKGSLRELADSRARLASAAERERRKLERDLHDGAQQRLVAAAINLTLADEAGDDRELHDRIADSRAEVEQAMTALREIAHGLYPTALARSGLSRAFEWLAGRSQDRVMMTAVGVGRFSPEIELAVYYCGLEAVQNASKHAGPQARVWIRLDVEADELRLDGSRGHRIGGPTSSGFL
ncbi:MAG TPA: histidine kinase [Solirubrobacteraceae bacterium]|nr:histidine kinase [Solirubrobacteraceae bacterium]